MTTREVNIMVDIRQVLESETRDVLVGSLQGEPGVNRARVSARVPRLMFVDYDPTRTDTRRILGAMTRRGFDPRLVDM